MGEILYHRVISMIKPIEKKRFIEKKYLTFGKIIALFFALTGLTIGGNALFNILTENTGNHTLFLLSIVFSLIIPIFILIVRPDLIISIDDKDN
jgi:Na+-transporting NADH:ubiquinone oxidoreductase subunit NqrB